MFETHEWPFIRIGSTLGKLDFLPIYFPRNYPSSPEKTSVFFNLALVSDTLWKTEKKTYCAKEKQFPSYCIIAKLKLKVK